MVQGLDSTKTAARPSHEAIEKNASATEAGKTAQQKADDVAMQSAKRAKNRIHSNENSTSGNTVFTK